MEKNTIVNDWIWKNVNNSILFFHTNAHAYFAFKNVQTQLTWIRLNNKHI